MKFMTDKFKKNLPPGENGIVRLDPRESNGAFDNPRARHPSSEYGKVRLDPRESDGTFHNAKPKPLPVAQPPKQTNPGQPVKPKPPGGVFTKPGAPSKQSPISPIVPRKGGIRLDPRERNGFNTGVNQSQRTQRAAKGGMHQEFMKQAKEKGISEKEITRFIARKMKPGNRK